MYNIKAGIELLLLEAQRGACCHCRRGASRGFYFCKILALLDDIFELFLGKQTNKQNPPEPTNQTNKQNNKKAHTMVP